jgi:GntR family transcriptional regulator
MVPPEPQRFIIPPISSAAPGPLYQQIIDGIKREISEGHLRPGTALPSFRALAEDLMVSLITVKRAYEDLEREGIIHCKQGLGTFVSEKGAERSRQAKREQARLLLRQALRESTESGATNAEIMKMVREMLEHNQEED